jgi:phage shock protein E
VRQHLAQEVPPLGQSPTIKVMSHLLAGSDDSCYSSPSEGANCAVSASYLSPMKTYLLLLTLCFHSVLAADQSVRHVDGKQAHSLVAKRSTVVIDVRSAEEFQAGHIAGAINIDIGDRNKPVLVHCARGGRSTKALATFQKLGFADISHLDGGYTAYLAAGK